MRIGVLFIFTLATLLLFCLDWYVFQGLVTLTAAFNIEFFIQSVLYGHWIFSAGILLFMCAVIFNFRQMRRLKTWAGSIFTTVLVTKLVFVFVLMGGDFFVAMEGGYNWLAGHTGEDLLIRERPLLVSQLAVLLAAIPFTSFLYGITRGKYRYKVHEHTLYFDDLPDAFDGFTITQISDLHSGSLDDVNAVRKGVELIKAQKSDLFVFTGDLVNSRADEFLPWLDIFKQIDAPFGQFSILGNHDYGDYHNWPSEKAKEANLNTLKEHHAATGFRLLLDEHIRLEKDGKQIYLLGVENWGVGFGKRGDLKKALQDVPEKGFKVLLSHDPSHWEHEVISSPDHIHLTLSGHTHGMQMGFELPGFKWSPVKYRYPRWAGIYEENGKYLNVNRGFGFHGFAGRVGIWPEITVLKLKKKKGQ